MIINLRMVINNILIYKVSMKKIVWNFLFCVALALSVFAAAHAQSATEKTSASKEVVSPPANEYRIGPEDVLDISVWKEDALKKEVLVRPDGGISFPLVGELQALDKTPAQIQQEITQKLTRYIPNPVVSVSVLRIVSNKIYVVGKVNRPGEFLTGRNLDVLQALSMAGGLTPYAAENKIKILRREGGKEISIPFEYAKVQSGNDLSQNIQLKRGDVVMVP
ncbi:MAG: polysaccharide biosynthesis/export family protein [Burkholderiales bacterium]